MSVGWRGVLTRAALRSCGRPRFCSPRELVPVEPVVEARPFDGAPAGHEPLQAAAVLTDELVRLRRTPLEATFNDVIRYIAVRSEAAAMVVRSGRTLPRLR